MIALLGGAGYGAYRQCLVPEIRIRNYHEMLKVFCLMREATVPPRTGQGSLPEDLAGLARYSPDLAIHSEVIAADFSPITASSSKPTPSFGHFFRLPP